MIKLYSKDGLTEKAELRKFTYNGQFMGACDLLATLSSPIEIDFAIGDYCEYRGERFTLNYEAAKSKKARRLSTSDAFVYDNVKFNSQGDDLTMVEFMDVVPNDNEIHFTTKSQISFYADSANALAERIQANLDYYFKGEKKFNLTVLPEAISEGKFITIEAGTSLWNVITLFNEQFGLNYTIRNRDITVGTAGVAVGKVLGYGKGNGLYDIEQTTNVDARIITRLRAYGSTKNMPRFYYNELKDENGNPYISKSNDIPNLMLPNFPYQERDPRNVFIDSDNKDKYGLRYGTVYFDGRDDEHTEIYPSIEGMTKQQLNDAGISVSLPPNDNGIINEVLGAENPDDDGLIPDEGKGEIAAQFKIILKDLGFDLTEKDDDGQYKYATQDTMQISMKSGMCVARTFDIVENGIVKDTSLGYTRYIIECNREEDNSIQGGTAFPNNVYKIEAGDKFVILGIAMPDVYVKAAAQRLLVAGKEFLAQNDSTKYNYIPKVDEIFMANNPQIAEKIKEGDILSFTDDDLNIDVSQIIQTLTITYDAEKSIIPTYDVVVNDERIASTLEKMQNSINMLVSNQTGISLDQVKSLINAIGGSLFLSKKFDDIAQGLIRFVRGLNVGDFRSGIFGSGGTFSMKDGDSYLEVDRLLVRKLAHFVEVLIERASHIGASNILSMARMICSSVEELDNVYRCYFETGDNNEFVQEFIVGDQARCQVFTGSTQKYYWRLVEAIGTDYIDLSKTDFDSGSAAPAVGDHIFQLGNRTDKTRQNAQILSSFGVDAPSYKQYQGIDSYSLEGKEKTVISPEGNRFEGAMKIEAGSLGWENLVGLPEEFQNLASGTVNLLRNSGFTGDYVSKRLTTNTKLQADTHMFSERLAHWEGFGTVNKDADSLSGYSATILNQSLKQAVPIIFTENYVISFKGKGETIKVSVGGEEKVVSLSADYQRYTIKLKAGDSKVFEISGRGTICEIMLERGTLGSDWSMSPLDNDKTLAQFDAIRYITDSVRNGSTTILGGLILSSMINLGNYVNGEMKEVTAGMSGIYNNDLDPAFWAGGKLETAIKNAVNPFTKNPENIINFLVTHGGRLIANEAIIRGNITATSGKIGEIEIDKDGIHSAAKNEDGKAMFSLNGKDGSGWFAGGGISWDELANLLISGRFESNRDGNRIVIEPATRSIQMVRTDGYILSSHTFRINDFMAGSEQKYRGFNVLDEEVTTQVGTQGIYIYNGGGDHSDGSEALSIELINNKLRFYMYGSLPDNVNDVGTYGLYRDGDVIKIRLPH